VSSGVCGVTILYLPRFHWQALGQPALGSELPPVMQALYGRNRRGPGSALYPGNQSERWAGIGGAATPQLLQFGSRARIHGFKRLKVDVDAFRGTRKHLADSGLFLTAPSKKTAAGKKTAKKSTAGRTGAPAKKTAPAKKVSAREVSAKKLGHTDDVPMMWRGHRLKARTILMLRSAERRLGQRLVITQGCSTPRWLRVRGPTTGAGSSTSASAARGRRSTRRCGSCAEKASPCGTAGPSSSSRPTTFPSTSTRCRCSTRTCPQLLETRSGTFSPNVR
jgi:hypothetical protein